jgi:hypothetical protein
MTQPRTPDEFKAAHDPTFKLDAVDTVYRRDIPKGTRRYIVTAAQNATPVDPVWWSVIQTMAKFKGAEILVIPLRYKNPTSRWTASQRNEEYWAPEVRPYLWNARTPLNKNLTVLGDIKIQPTASSPLTGSDALSLASSGIIGHTKLHLKAVPTPSNRMAKILTTTGACTVANYTDTRAGRIGEFHHSLSAVLVEIDGSKFHLRQLHFDRTTGTCTDLDTRYSDHDTTEPAPRALALVMGDTHVEYVDPDVVNATFGPGGIVEVTRPEHLVWHDLLDGYACNPHHAGNPFNMVAKRRGNTDDVRAEVERAIDFVHYRTPYDTQSVVVASNHDDFLRRWIISNDWRKDPVNAEFYLETALAMVKGTQLGTGGTEYPCPFAYWLNKAASDRVRSLGMDESFVLGGVELGMHGDAGPNGARGSIKNLRRIGIRSIIGHSHSPGIDEGTYQTGTSTRLRLEYNHGPSGWINAHCLLNADGKRQLIIVVDGDWRA